MDSAIIAAAMVQASTDARTPFSYDWVTYVWVLAWAMAGGCVSFIQKVKAGQARAFNFAEFVGEVFTSAFVGVLTFWLCEWAGFSQMLSAVFIAITGHMGSRALFLGEQLFVKWLGKRFDLKIGDDAKEKG